MLDFTRAYTMVRFFDSDMLQLSDCSRCGGQFVAHAHDNKHGYVCVLCRPPSRAGKARGSKRDRAADVTQSRSRQPPILPCNPALGASGVH